MTQNDSNFQIKEPYRSIILWIFGIVALISLLSPILFHKKPNRNYGSYGTWEANENFPIVLEAVLERRSGSLRSAVYYDEQLYLHANGEKFKCVFLDPNGNQDITHLLYYHSTRRIELAEVTFSIALGERVISRDGLRYCRISKARFKHFSDIEHIALKLSTNKGGSFKPYGKELYHERVEFYKKKFF